MRTAPGRVDQRSRTDPLVAPLYVVAGPVSRQSGGLNSESAERMLSKVVSDGKRVAAFLFDANLPPPLISVVRSAVWQRLRVKFLWYFFGHVEDSAEMLAA